MLTIDNGPSDWIIASAMHTDESLAYIRQTLDPATLYSEAHRTILTACLKLQERGEPASAVSVIQQLQSMKPAEASSRCPHALAEVGGASRITDLAAGQASSVPALLDKWISAIVVEDTRRRVDAAARRMIDAAADPTVDAAELVEAALTHVASVRDRVDRGAADGRYSGLQAVQNLADGWSSDDAVKRIPWPSTLPKLAAATGGGQRRGWIVISGARTGVGKTWLGLDCAMSAFEAGERVAYFTLEMPAGELLERIAAMRGAGSLDGIVTRETPWRSVQDAVLPIANADDQFVFLDGVTTPARIRSELVAAQAVGRPFTYVVIDTVNLVEVPGAESYRLGLNALLRDLKSLAVRNRCVIHLQAQLKRDDLGGGNNAPKLTDLRESSAMEQTGDVVLLLHRPVAGDGNFEAVGELHLAKARSSRRRGAIQVAFDEFRFREGGLYRAGAPRPGWGVVA